MNRIRVLLAEDHETVRQGLRMLLDAQPDIEVVAEAANGIEAVAPLPNDAARTSSSSTSRCRK